MKDLLKLEFRKLKNQKSFYIITAIMVIFTLIAAFTSKFLADFVTEANEAASELSGETMPVSGLGILLGFASMGNFQLLAAIFVSINVCDDYENSIVKNIFSRGYSRVNYCFAKFVYVLAVTSIMCLISVALSAVLGAALFGIESADFGKVILLLFLQYIVCMTCVSLFFCISTALRKLGASIAVNILVPSVFSLILGLIDTLLIKSSDFAVSDGWFMNFTTDLSDLTVGAGRIAFCAAASIIYFAAFTLLGTLAGKKAEI